MGKERGFKTGAELTLAATLTAGSLTGTPTPQNTQEPIPITSPQEESDKSFVKKHQVEEEQKLSPLTESPTPSAKHLDMELNIDQEVEEKTWLDQYLESSPNLSQFEEEFKSDPVLQEILLLQEDLKEFPDDYQGSVFSFLQTTRWYNSFVNDENRDQVNRILEFATSTRVEGQPLQCVGFVIILSNLYPELNIPNIGGAHINSAKDLIPDYARGFTSTEVATRPLEIGGLINIAKGMPIDVYERGNLFVRDRYQLSRDGHVGVILAKNLDSNGNTILLIADSNFNRDGLIEIYVVNESNIEEVFGPANANRYVISK